jgi:hypothetical protein
LHFVFYKNHCIGHFRVLLAALHYNENGNKPHAVTETGEEKWSIHFPKFKKGGYSVRPIKTASTYGLKIYYQLKKNF